MGYRSVYGRKLGLSGDQLLVKGRAVGGSMPTGLGRGRTYYVSSVINAGNGDTIDGAAGTLQEVIDRIDIADAAGYDVQGATIVVLPDHNEIITGVGGLTFDVPGLRVIGLGAGSRRPALFLDAGTTLNAVVNGRDDY